MIKRDHVYSVYWSLEMLANNNIGRTNELTKQALSREISNAVVLETGLFVVRSFSSM